MRKRKLVNWLDKKSTQYLGVTMKTTPDDPRWQKANELYKFYDEINFKIAGLDGLYHNRQNGQKFIDSGVLLRLRSSYKLKTIHPRLTNADE